LKTQTILDTLDREATVDVSVLKLVGKRVIIHNGGTGDLATP
jgi:hypothetical protein